MASHQGVICIGTIIARVEYCHMPFTHLDIVLVYLELLQQKYHTVGDLDRHWVLSFVDCGVHSKGR